MNEAETRAEHIDPALEPASKGDSKPEQHWPPQDVERGKYQLFELRGFSASSRLWRYMSFEKFCYLIESSKLYHARLDQFMDPFEGSVTHAYAQQRDSGILDPYFSRVSLEPWIFKHLRLRSYAVCWYAGEEESDAQWRLYGAGDGGIAIVSTLQRLYQAVSFTQSTGLLSDVQYVDFEKHDMLHRPFCTSMRPGFLKRKAFEHEKELRGIIQVEPNEDAGRLDDEFLERLRTNGPRGVEADVLLPELLEEVVLSPLAPPYMELIVRRLTARHGLDRLVRRSKLCEAPSY